MAELLLHVALISLRGGGKAGTQRMPGEFLPPLGFGKITPHPGGQRRALDQPGDVPVGQPVGAGLLAVARDPPEQRPMRNAAQSRPGLQGCDRAGGVAGAAANLDLAPPGLAAYAE
jgi:hypothetical protein